MAHLCSRQMKKSSAGNPSEVEGNYMYVHNTNTYKKRIICINSHWFLDNWCWFYFRIFHKLGSVPLLFCTQIISSNLGSNCWALSTNSRHAHCPQFIFPETCSHYRSALLHVRFYSSATRSMPVLDIFGVHSLVGEMWSSLDWSASRVWPVSWRHGKSWEVTWSCHRRWGQGSVSAVDGSTGCSTNMEDTSFPFSFGKSLV